MGIFCFLVLRGRGGLIGERDAFLSDVTGVIEMAEGRRRISARRKWVRRVRSRRGAPGGACGEIGGGGISNSW